MLQIGSLLLDILSSGSFVSRPMSWTLFMPILLGGRGLVTTEPLCTGPDAPAGAAAGGASRQRAHRGGRPGPCDRRDARNQPTGLAGGTAAPRNRSSRLAPRPSRDIPL